MPRWQKVQGTGCARRSFDRLLTGTLLVGSLLLASLASPTAQAAATLSVYPLKLRIGPGRVADSITLGNDGRQAVTVETRLLQWQFAAAGDAGGDAREQLLPTTELLATPPVFTVAAGATRVIRIGRLSNKAPETIEASYRLELSEVPDETARPVNGGAQTVLTISLPVFLGPSDRKAAADLEVRWLAAAKVGEPPRLAIGNRGGLHARLTTASLLQGGRACATKTFGAYLLPGSQRALAWPEVSACARGAAELQLDFEAKPRRLTVPVQLGAAAADPARP